MINLKKFGFKYVDCCNNRDFYSNGIIDIIGHNGSFFLDKHNGKFWSDIALKSDEDVEKYLIKFKAFLQKKIEAYNSKIEAIDNLLNDGNNEKRDTV